MLRTVNPPPGMLLIAGRLNYAQQYATGEQCLACTHDILPTELVYLVEDEDELRWLVHQICLEGADFHKVSEHG